MFAVSLLRHLGRLRPTGIKRIIFPIRNVHVEPPKTKYNSPLNSSSRVEKDVVLYTLEKPNFFLAVNALSALQCLFWSYLGVFFYTSLKSSEFSVRGKEFWNRVLEIERKYSAALSVISILFGWGILCGTLIYTSRSVRKLILHEGGRNVTIITYNVPGLKDTIQVPLSKISAAEHRTKAKKYLPFKIKNKFFYYLMDVRGEFSHPELFDYTVGVRRSI